MIVLSLGHGYSYGVWRTLGWLRSGMARGVGGASSTSIFK